MVYARVVALALAVCLAIPAGSDAGCRAFLRLVEALWRRGRPGAPCQHHRGVVDLAAGARDRKRLGHEDDEQATATDAVARDGRHGDG